ncbi:hypothetical protein A3727_22170 [Erythrobacter sp. HI0038]|nr:hypothetical protein A3727_22170 [Erythrobacter sp. HI0038]
MKIEEVLRLAWVEFAKTDSAQSYKSNQPIWRLNLQERSVEQSLGEIARKWSRNSEKGKGLRLDPVALDRLNEIGVGELIQAEAARQQRLECAKRISPSTNGETTNSSTIGRTTAHSEPPTSRSSGMTQTQDVSEASRRARRMLK